MYSINLKLIKHQTQMYIYASIKQLPARDIS